MLIDSLTTVQPEGFSSTLGQFCIGGNIADALSVYAAEHNSSPHHQRLRGAMAAHSTLQLPPICGCHFHSATLYAHAAWTDNLNT
jgi:hypothetical protein